MNGAEKILEMKIEKADPFPAQLPLAADAVKYGKGCRRRQCRNGFIAEPDCPCPDQRTFQKEAGTLSGRQPVFSIIRFSRTPAAPADAGAFLPEKVRPAGQGGFCRHG